jgi:hypothetical protein
MAVLQDQRPLFEIPKALEHGVKNPIVARLTVQMREILDKTTLSKNQGEKIGGVIVDSLVKELLRCWEIEQRIRADWEKSVANFRPPGPDTTTIEVPQIPRLREDCEEFLDSAKNFLRDLINVFSALHGTKYKDASEWAPVGKRTDSVLAYARATFGEKHANAKYFDQIPARVMPFVEMRNAVEHPNGFSGSLITENISLKNGRELVAPRWHRDKEDTILYGPAPIIEDMSAAVNNLLVLAEDVAVMWAVDHLAAPSGMEIVVIAEAQRDQNCPIKYRLSPKSELIQAIPSMQSARR